MVGHVIKGIPFHGFALVRRVQPHDKQMLEREKEENGKWTKSVIVEGASGR